MFEGDGILKNIRTGQIVVDLRNFLRQPDPRLCTPVAGQGCILGRCADRAHPPGRAGWNAERHGRRHPGAVRRDRAADPLFCDRCHPLRRHRRRAGNENPQQHGVVPTVNALSEAVAVAKRNAVDPALLLDTLSKGSADSFALRNHGLKAIVPGNFPERAFSTEYALKDLGYALELAADAGIKIRGAELTGRILQEAIDAGSGGAYFPVIAKHLEGAQPAMIERFPGLTPTRSRAVIHDDLVFTVAVAPDPVTSSMYEQSAKALGRIDESLALCGTDKSRILSAIVYITDMTRKSEMNRAWDEWVDTANPPMRACIGVDLEPPHIVEVVVTAAK